MSSEQSHPHSESHTGPVKTPKQLLMLVFYAFVIPVFVIIGLVYFVTSGTRPSDSTNENTMALNGVDAVDRDREVAMRISKVGEVKLQDANRPAASGEQVYQAQCSTCHATGASGSPKFCDTSVWAARIALGQETLTKSAIQGKGGMSPQSGGEFTDTEIAKAVVYMANAAGAKFTEPAAQAADAVDAKTLYGQVCASCHDSGAAGAPKFGDKAAWSARLSLGVDGLTASAMKGKGNMPAKGGSNFDEGQMKAVVEYMVKAVQ